MKQFFSLSFFLCISLLVFGQKTQAEKYFHRVLVKSNMTLKKAQRMKPEKVKFLNYANYSDSIFPNAELLNYKNLEYLKIYGRNIKKNRRDTNVLNPIKLTIDTIGLKQLKSLKYLDIAFFDMSDFPKELFNFNQLELLSIKCCFINKIPNNISNLDKLEILDLTFNNLAELPIDICNLKSLKTLWIPNNNFTIIPEILNSCNNLKIINLANSEVSLEFPMFSSTWPFPSHINKINYSEQFDLINKIILKNNIENFYVPLPTCQDRENLLRLINDETLSKKMNVNRITRCRLLE